jgi:hypothetical protein
MWLKPKFGLSVYLLAEANGNIITQLAILPFISKSIASASEPARVTIPSFTK